MLLMCITGFATAKPKETTERTNKKAETLAFHYRLGSFNASDDSKGGNLKSNLNKELFITTAKRSVKYFLGYLPWPSI